MGVQSALCRLFLKDVGSTNVMTSNITQFAINLEAALAELSGSGGRDAAAEAMRSGSVIFAFLAGVIVGSAAFATVGAGGLIAVTAVLAALSCRMLFASRWYAAGATI